MRRELGLATEDASSSFSGLMGFFGAFIGGIWLIFSVFVVGNNPCTSNTVNQFLPTIAPL